jgi:hypothetical protein
VGDRRATCIYRDLRLFNEQQSAGIWREKDTETLIGRRVVVLDAGDLAVNHTFESGSRAKR